MSLIDLMTEPYVLMEKTRVADGEGGFITTWTEGAEIQAALTLDTTMSARIAEKEGVTSTYTVTVAQSIALEYHDVLKRVSDGTYYRITSDFGDKKTPTSSTLNISQATAEKWELTQ